MSTKTKSKKGDPEFPGVRSELEVSQTIPSNLKPHRDDSDEEDDEEDESRPEKNGDLIATMMTRRRRRRRGVTGPSHPPGILSAVPPSKFRGQPNARAPWMTIL